MKEDILDFIKSEWKTDDRLRLGVLIAAIACPVAGFAIALYLFMAFRFNDNGLIANIREFGFPWSGGFTMTFIFYVIAIVAVVKIVGNKMKADPLGRNIVLSLNKQHYGNAVFERPKQYQAEAEITPVEEAQGTIVGQLDNTGKRVISTRMDNFRMNRHMIVFGASGSGKTYTFVKNYAYQVTKRRESVIMSDPDGGLYRDLAGYFMDKGYKVRRFDLSTLEKSDGWDCLRSLQSANMEVDIQMIAQTIMANVANPSGDIFAAAGKSLLTALLLYVMLAPEYEGKRTLTSAYQLLKHPDGEKGLDKLFGNACLSPKLSVAADAYNNYKTGSDNLRGNIITNVSTYLQILGVSSVQKILSQDDIDTVAPGLEPCAYFCIFPDNHDTFKFLVSMFMSTLFVSQITYADTVLDGPLPVPVNYLLDEFPSLGVFPDWARKMATIRKRNMHVVMICQDETQLQANYRDSWVTVMQNCATMISLGINDQYTAKMISDRIGDTTVEVQTSQYSTMQGIFSAFNTGYSQGSGKAPLLSYDQLFKLPPDQCIILFQRHNPILAYVLPHVKHPDSKLTWPITRNEIPSIDDVETRKRWRKMENQKIEKWKVANPDIVKMMEERRLKTLSASWQDDYSWDTDDFEDEKNILVSMQGDEIAPELPNSGLSSISGSIDDIDSFWENVLFDESTDDETPNEEPEPETAKPPIPQFTNYQRRGENNGRISVSNKKPEKRTGGTLPD